MLEKLLRSKKWFYDKGLGTSVTRDSPGCEWMGEVEGVEKEMNSNNGKKLSVGEVEVREVVSQ